MGAKARASRTRRTALRQLADSTAARHAAVEASPEYAAEIAGSQDDETRALVAAGLPAQAERLTRAGFRQSRQAGDGAGCWDHRRRPLRIIHSVSREADGQAWAHVSVSHYDNSLPGWYEVRDAQWLLYPDQPGLVVIAPVGEHVDIANVAHVWTCLTARVLPDFRHLGMI